MEQEELKRKLLGLWEKTTHNSKDFISILFDYYFDVNYVEYKEFDGKIISALCGIPYSFGYGDKTLKGLYLISLSSEEGFRKKGILSELLNNINARLQNEFDFTFLIPQTELLADYFATQEYYHSFYILEERFTPLHNFKNDYILSLTDSDERIRNLKIALTDAISVYNCNNDPFFNKENVIKFIQTIEKKGSSAVCLSHTRKDLDFLLQYDSLNFLETFIAYDSDETITGIAFIQKEDIKRLKVVAFYVTDTCTYYSLLDYIKRQYPDYSLSVITSEIKYQTHALIQQTYASSNAQGSDLDNTFSTVEIPFNFNKLLQPMGMARILRYDKIIEYLAVTRSDVNFKLHIRDFYFLPQENQLFSDTEVKESAGAYIFIVKNGNLTIQPYSNFLNDRSIISLSKKEFSELLLRKNDSSNLIMEAFGIPRLNLQMRLLPN